MINTKPIKIKRDYTLVIEFSEHLSYDEVAKFTTMYEELFNCKVAVVTEQMNLTVFESED